VFHSSCWCSLMPVGPFGWYSQPFAPDRAVARRRVIAAPCLRRRRAGFQTISQTAPRRGHQQGAPFHGKLDHRADVDRQGVGDGLGDRQNDRAAGLTEGCGAGHGEGLGTNCCVGVIHTLFFSVERAPWSATPLRQGESGITATSVIAMTAPMASK